MRIAVLISGGGTTLGNLIEARAGGQLDVEIALVVASTASAGGLRFADEAGIAAHVVEAREFSAPGPFSERVFALCRAAAVDLVVLGGFLRLLVVPPDFDQRVINIHPSLIPVFSGKGFYGPRVHRAVLDYGCKVSGCTVHFVDNQYDHGPIIAQRCVPVENDDTPEALAARVFAAECDLYPEVIRWIAAGRVEVRGRTVIVR
jgi:phosphoribosylglycinamide formyltransferase 1